MSSESDQHNTTYEHSDDEEESKIEDSPKKRKHSSTDSQPEEDEYDTNEIIANIEKNMRNVIETATKRNLSVVNVKNILKHVFKNEHVLALGRKAENPSETLVLDFEPKLTRAKAKALYPESSPSNWVSPGSTLSETQVLISDELQGDSSGDEYIPAEEESEDDSLAQSDLSQDPPTPQSADCATQTTWTEDGIFKVPTFKTKAEAEEANIARRTRSKLCLTGTPLEEIEEAFIPPDITTDMYDMDCDDDDWKDFLTEFTRPLKEVAKEDEDHDPEYNVLADEEMDKVDKEELRADKAVTISRKELNVLMTELFEFADIFNDGMLDVPDLETGIENNLPLNEISSTQTPTPPPPLPPPPSFPSEQTEPKPSLVQHQWVALLEQQLRQHVQLLTQQFMLMYEHPEYHGFSLKCKQYLYALQDVFDSHQEPIFPRTLNLNAAIELITSWEDRFHTDDDFLQEYKQFAVKDIYAVVQAKLSGTFYIPKFHKEFLSVVSQSTVFIYPSLLPRIPFKVSSVFPKISSAISSENHLISIGLEQFVPYLQANPVHLTPAGELKLKDLCYYINKFLIPWSDPGRLCRHISNHKRSLQYNPIQYYYKNRKAPQTVHYVVNLEKHKVLPPGKRAPYLLPEQWKNFNYPEIEKQSKRPDLHVTLSPSPITKVTKPPVYNKNFTKRRKLFKSKPKTPLKNNSAVIASNYYEPFGSSTPIAASLKIDVVPYTPIHRTLGSRFSSFNKRHIPDEVRKLKFNSSIFSRLEEEDEDDDMLPSMPMLGLSSNSQDAIEVKAESILPTDTIERTEDDASRIIHNDVEEEHAKDNIEDINALLVASSTIRNLTKRKVTGAEKKKAKMLREYNANLRMLSEESDDVVNEKTDRFVQAFYDKVQEKLELPEYHQFMEVLNSFDEKRDTTTQLYNSVARVIGPNHPDLLDEFLSFFTALQAKKLGKLMPYLMMNNMSLFLRKLEMFYKDRPMQVRKIYRALTELAATQDVTIAQVKNTIVPLLKGNSLLIDWFLQIFPTEKPPDRLLNGTWETITMPKDTVTNEDHYEMITVPEVEDPYGGPNCICSCHSINEHSFNTKSRHCIPCGTKFFQGRVYVQTAKGLRLAKVSFGDEQDHSSRLSYNWKTKRTETSPAKQISPGKDSQDENRLSSDDEPDKKQQRVLKPPRKRKPKKKVTDTLSVEVKTDAIKQETEVVEKEQGEQLKKDADHQTENTSDSSMNEVKHPVEENPEWDCNTSIESIELKFSPDHASTESESEFCEDTSQENNSDTSGGESESEPAPTQWSREEDKVILETFQKQGNNEEAFQIIASRLENRSLPQIKKRFETLISLLMQMTQT